MYLRTFSYICISFKNIYQIHFNSQLFDYHFNVDVITNEGRIARIIEKEKPLPNTYNLTRNVKIKYSDDNTEEWLSIRDLKFSFNLIK